MSIWASLEPAAATVDPGSSTTIRLRIRNTSDVVEEYRISPAGDLAPYIAVEPEVLRLYPDATGTADVTLAPPRTPDVPAGPNPFALQITPTEHPDQVVVPEGNLTVTPFHEIRAELLPGSVRGRWRARPHLAVDNLGNAQVSATLRGSDQASELRYDLRPNTVQIDPGRAAFVRLGLRPARFLWAGRAQKHDYTVEVVRAGAKPVTAKAEYHQPALLAGWLSRLMMVLVAVAVVFVTLWFAFRPSIASSTAAKAEPTPVGAVVDPPSATPSAPAQQSPPPSPSQQAPSPSSSPKQEKPASSPKADTPKKPAADPRAELTPQNRDKKVRLQSGQSLFALGGQEVRSSGKLADGNQFLTGKWNSTYWANVQFTVHRYRGGVVALEPTMRLGSVLQAAGDNLRSVGDIGLPDGAASIRKGELSDSQRWTMRPVNDDPTYFRLVNKKTGGCMTDETTLPVSETGAGMMGTLDCTTGNDPHQVWHYNRETPPE